MSDPVPLGEMSPNIQESDTASRKRSHDEFADEGVVHIPSDSEPKRQLNTSIQPTGEALIPPAPDRIHLNSSPQASPALTEGGQSTTTQNSSPQTPSKLASKDASDQKPATDSATQSSATNPPPAKRKRLTAAEKEARDKEAAEKKEQREKEAADKKKERDEKAAVRAAEQARQEQEKAARAQEREEKKKIKEEEDRIKAQEKEEKRKKKEEEDKVKAEKAKERDEKKRKKEEEQQKIQEAKEKKARQQPTLSSFFGAPSTPKKPATSTDLLTKDSPQKASPGDTPSKPVLSEYQKRFQPFFVKEHTSMAPSSTQMDGETKESKSAILDEFITGKRTLEASVKFDAVKIFCLHKKPQNRGRLHHPVKQIMEDVYKETEGGSNGDKAMQDARAKLRKVPMKVIAFSQDVRPPYFGTVTFRPFVLGKQQMRKLARLSTGRRLPLDYEYDSEAEWQEEEGEDLDAEDDEEEIDDEDDMDGFLDDSEDAGPARRMVFNAMEPESSGVCFENERRQGPNEEVYQHKMEIIEYPQSRIDAGTVDPWSTAYWEPEAKPKAVKAVEKPATKMLPPVAPANAFAALTRSTPAATNGPKLVKQEIMDDVKQAILDNKSLSKIGIIEFVFHQFRDNATRTEVKNTIETVAEKQGTGRSKEWVLKAGQGTAA